MQIGITVLTDFILSEGIEAVLDNIVGRSRASGVALNPTVSAPASKNEGSPQPPSDGDTSPRHFDRPLWGKTHLRVTSAASFVPNRAFYSKSKYGPRRTSELTVELGAVVGQFVRSAHRRGLKVYFQIGAASPPGLEEADWPRTPDGRPLASAMARSASLAVPAVRDYYRAYLKDLVASYPEIDGLRVDWPEYPCYTFEEAFSDFHPEVARYCGAERLERLGTAIRPLFECRGLDNLGLETLLSRMDDTPGTGAAERPKLEAPGSLSAGLASAVAELFGVEGAAVADWLALKQELALEYLLFLREALDDAGGSAIELAPNAFPPSFSTLTGFPYAEAHRAAPWVGVKLYTMHWPQILRFWIDGTKERVPGVDRDLLARVLTRAFGVGDLLPQPVRNQDIRYPLPEEPHPESDASQAEKLRQAVAASRCEVAPIVHGYGPLDDFRRRLRVAADNAASSLWVNRYGYLSDAKLEAVGKVTRA